jgi:rhamnosyltransferase
MFPKVAVLLTTYDGSSFLYEQILSIRSQKEVSLSVFISDDLSTDDTKDVINFCVQQWDVIRVFDNLEKAHSPAHNFFSLIERIDLDEFDYVVYSDQDDVWLPNKISHAIETIIDNKVDCYASNLYIWTNDNQELKILKKDQPQTSVDYLFQSASAGCTYCLSKDAAILLKNVLARHLPRSPKIISHDWITYAVTRSHGFKWVIDNSSQIMYRQHTNNFYGSNVGFHGIFKRATLIKEKFYIQSLQYVASICRVDEVNQKFISAIDRLNLIDRFFLFTNFYLLRRKKEEGLILGILFIFKII